MALSSASKNLCQEFYELTGIEPPLLWARSKSGEWKLVSDKNSPEYYDHSPAYDLHILIVLLPPRRENIQSTAMLGRSTNNKGWACVWNEIASIADTPEDAVMVLLLKALKHNLYKIEYRV